MEAYFVRVLTDKLVGMLEQRAISIWVVCAASPEDAIRIITGRIMEGQEVQGVNQATAGTAERFNLTLGQARLL